MAATETACEPHVRRHALRWRGHAWAAALLGWVLGTALHVQQPVLWAAGVYIGVTVFAFALTLLARRARPGAARALGWLLAAALALGAAAAQVGTAYLLCPEATTSAIHRAALQSEAARHTALTRLFTGRPARGIVNRVMRELGALSPVVPAFPLATSAMAPLRAHAERLGSGDFSPLWSGQNTSGCRAEGAAALTRQLAGL